MIELLLDPNFYVSLLTLSILEIVLGIDNIIVIAILVNKLPLAQRAKARFIGLLLAMVARILLLLTLNWISHLIQPLFSISSFQVTGRDIVLFLGGLFLLYKATSELLQHLLLSELKHKISSIKNQTSKSMHASFASSIAAIVVVDIVFSLDSVITAIGIANEIIVMILAVIIAIFIMMTFSGIISRFINKYPSIKVLALTFLILVGFVLVAEGLHYHIDKVYIYVAMMFSLAVSIFNIIYEVKYRNYATSHEAELAALAEYEEQELQALHNHTKS